MREDKFLLEDILEAIESIQKYATQGKGSFQKDELIQTWMVHHLQVIEEAAKKISDTLKNQYPDIPWNQIIAMRHILVHDYFGVDLNEVWSSVEKDIPELEVNILKIVKNN